MILLMLEVKKIQLSKPHQKNSLLQEKPKMTGVIGNIEIFNFDEDNFAEYLERFEYIFTAYSISHDKMKTALLMSMAGNEFHSKVTS